MAIANFKTMTFTSSTDLAIFVVNTAGVNKIISIIYPSDGSGNWVLFYK
jgi:hypothetical protein